MHKKKLNKYSRLSKTIKIICMTFVVTLVSTFINISPAVASDFKSNRIEKIKSAKINGDPKFASVPQVLKINKSHNDLGETYDPTVKFTFDKNYKKSDATEFVYLYNVDTGVLMSSNEVYDRKGSELPVSKFADYGDHHYQIFLSKQSSWNYEAPENIDDLDFDLIVGKSNIIEWSRFEPITIALEQFSDEKNMSQWRYKMNQRVNDSDNEYMVLLYNIETGSYIDGSVAGIEGLIGASIPNTTKKKSYLFRAVLAKQDLEKYYWSEGDYSASYNDILDYSVAFSNIVSYERESWSVNVELDDYYPNSPFKISTVQGGGRFSTYLVENSTQNIIWNDANGSIYGADYNIDKRGHTDTAWVTAYVAKSYSWFDLPEPKKLDDLQEIIASSDGSIVDRSSGVTGKREVAGGKNLSEKCNILCTADPINNYTGEFFDKKTDLTTVGSGLIPNIERSFSTVDKDFQSSLGAGWRTNYEMSLKVEGDYEDENYDSNPLNAKVIEVENENGSITSFYRSSNGSYIAEKSNTMASLKFDESSKTFEYEIFSSKEKFTFDSTGKLLKISNDKNQTVNLTYNDKDQLTKVSDLVGNNIDLAYNTSGNAAGLLSSVKAQNGKTATYTYNAKKQMIGSKNSDNINFVYTYDSFNRMKTLTNEVGGVTTNTYDDEYSNRVVKQVDPLKRAISMSYSSNGINEITEIKYPNGKIFQETYNKGQLVKRIENFGKTNVLTWLYSYDETGSLVSTINPDLTSTGASHDSRGNQTEHYDGEGNRTRFTYDAQDNLLTITDPLGNTTVNTYDSQNNLISTTTPLGEITTFVYDPNGLLISVTDARGNSSGANPADYTSTFNYLPNRLLSSSSDSFGELTEAKYDDFGQLISTKDARGFESSIAYNNLGLPSKIIDPLQNETALTYDQMGNVLTSKNAEGFVTSYTYDSVGNMLTTTNALNEKTTYTYSNMNKPLTITFSDGSIQKIKYDIFDRPIELTDELGRITKQTWNANSNLSTTVDADGGKTEYSYDRNGNLSTVKNPVGAVTKYSYDTLQQLISVTDPLGRVTKTVYDANGRVIEEIAADNTSVKTVYDSVGNIVETVNEDGKSKFYTFDSLNRQTSYTNETGQVTSYGYDATSNLTSQTRPDGSVVTYSYDARNLLTKIDYPGTEEDISYVYDKIGRKTSETKGSKDLTLYSYDSLNRIISQGSADSKVSYEYNAAGDLTRMTYPSGRVVDYGFDAAGQLKNIDTPGVQGMTLGHNNRGQETNAVLPNGVTETKSYDAAGRLLGSELTAAGNSIYKRTQQYSVANEVTQKGVYSNGETISLDDFAYDPTSKLISQKKSGTDESVNSYGYNTVGNLSAINSDDQVHDEAGKIVSSADLSITYDSRNNRSSITNTTDASENVEYVWAQNNLLSEVTTHEDSTSKTTKYEYSAGSLLESRSEGTVTDNFVWDINREIPVMLSDGKFEYIYKGNDRVPFAQVEIVTDIVTYLHSDLTGSIVASTSSDGSLIGKVDYSPYGEPTATTALSRFGYAGEWVDETTGYSFLRARWFDAKTGSFLSEDPLVQMTQNAFGYVEGDPLTQIDPLGLFWGEIGDWIYNNSTAISLGLTSVGILASATGFGAPVGIVLMGLSSAVSAYSSGRAYNEGDAVNGTLNLVGAIPGVAWIGATAKASKISVIATKQSNLLKTTSRRDWRNMSRKSDEIKTASDNTSIGLSFLSSVNNTLDSMTGIDTKCK